MQRMSLQLPRSSIQLLRGTQRPLYSSNLSLFRARFNSTIPPTAKPSESPLPKAPLKPQGSRLSPLRITLLFAKYTGFLVGSAAVGVLLVGAGVFIHDAFTYSEKHLDRVPVSPLALNPKLGGPNNLPIVEVALEDEENEGLCNPPPCYGVF
jgi:hypothetical protein